MPLDPHKVLNWKFPEVEHTYTEKDTILYALGLGCGAGASARTASRAQERGGARW